MRNTIKWMLENLDLKADFEVLRQDIAVQIAAVAHGVTVNRMAMELETRLLEAEKNAAEKSASKKEGK